MFPDAQLETLQKKAADAVHQLQKQVEALTNTNSELTAALEQSQHQVQTHLTSVILKKLAIDEFIRSHRAKAATTAVSNDVPADSGRPAATSASTQEAEDQHTQHGHAAGKRKQTAEPSSASTASTTKTNVAKKSKLAHADTSRVLVNAFLDEHRKMTGETLDVVDKYFPDVLRALVNVERQHIKDASVKSIQRRFKALIANTDNSGNAVQQTALTQKRSATSAHGAFAARERLVARSAQ